MVEAVTRSTSPGQSASWFLDETTLITELRRISLSRAAPPDIPGYDDLVELHRGGQGIVYAAVQRSTRRRVAIKVLVDGSLASDAARRRFEREIDLVSTLNHPHIVRIYDSGISDPPQPRAYFVMEYIEGVPLNEFAASAGRNPRIVLPLFARICRAISYAHQHGVIHRDLKPGNIRIDADGHPHILDFGLAKVSTANRAADPSVAVSVAGEFIGSLPWASPEQAQGAHAELDVRSDVYSLGVILYQMLTGTFPYDVRAGLRSVLDNIVSAEPMRPSTVDRTINDEIETIVLTCLAKEPERRYQSAAELALDVERYLKGEPIQAKRDSAWYTMRKRLRRYRMLGAAAALLVITLGAGVGTTLWQSQIASAQRDAAEQRFDDVRELARHVLFDLHDQIADLPGSRPARETLVTTALTYLEELADEAGDDRDLLAELAAGYLRIGDLQGRPSAPNLGDTTAAMISYRKANDFVARLAINSPADAHPWDLQINVQNAMAEVEAERGNIETALDHAHASLELAETLRQTDNANLGFTVRAAESHIKLGDVLGYPGRANAGRTLDAVAAYADAEQLLVPIAQRRPANPDLMRTLAMLHERQGTMLELQGKPDEALTRFDQSLDLRAKLAEAAPDSARALRDLGISHEKKGNAQRVMGDSDAAATSFARAGAVFNALLEMDPGNVGALRTSALNHERVGHLKEDMGDAPAAVQSMQTAADLFLEIARRDSANEQAQFMAAIGRINLADVLGHPYFANVSKPNESIEHYKRALETIAKLREADPDNLRRKRYYALVCERLGTMMLEVDQPSEARRYFEESMTLRAELAQDHAEHTDIQRDIGIAHEQLGKVLEYEGDFTAAIEAYERAIAVYTSLAAQHPNLPQFQRDIDTINQHITRCSETMNQSD